MSRLRPRLAGVVRRGLLRSRIVGRPFERSEVHQKMPEQELVDRLSGLNRWLRRPRTGPTFVRRRPCRPASADDIVATEQALGFTIPPLLVRIYREVGNGGFGPGYGLIGARGGFLDARGESIDQAYRGRAESDPTDPDWRWPHRLVPLFSWGGAVFTCGDFSDAECRLVEFDPHGWTGTDPMTNALRVHGRNLYQYLAAWVGGSDVQLD